MARPSPSADPSATVRRPSPGLVVPWIALLLAFVFAGAALAQPKFPALTGRIVDEARILSADDVRSIEATLKELEGKSSDQIVIYTTRSLQGYGIEDFGYQLGRFWKIGQAGTNNGIVLIVAPSERKVRIEVGRGLEGQMTDLMSGLIVNNAILPAFRRGDFPAGIRAGVRDIKDVLLGDTEEVKKRLASLKPRPTGSNTDWVPLVFFLVFIAIWLMMARAERQAAQQNPAAAAARRRRQGDRNIIIVPGGWGGSGGWSGGGGSSGDSGGGFSGGGGDFGGGGASGSW